MKKTVKIQIFGAVQGVSYRYHSSRKARQLGLTGWVRNEPEGSVLVVAEGEALNVEKFVAWCQRGSHGASIVRVEAEDLPNFGFKDFSVKR